MANFQDTTDELAQANSLLRDTNPWKDIYIVMTTPAERATVEQPGHFTGPFRLGDLPTEMFLEIARHLPPAALLILGQTCKNVRSLLLADRQLPARLALADRWEYRRLKERESDFQESAPLPCGHCLDNHPVEKGTLSCQRPRGTPGGAHVSIFPSQVEFFALPMHIAKPYAVFPAAAACVLPSWPTPTFIRYLAKRYLSTGALPELKNGTLSEMKRTAHSWMSPFYAETDSHLRFIDGKLFMRTQTSLGRCLPRTMHGIPSILNDGFIRGLLVSSYVCPHFGDKVDMLVDPLYIPPWIPAQQYLSQESAAVLKFYHEKSLLFIVDALFSNTTSFLRPGRPPAFLQYDSRVFTCDKCCTNWSITFPGFSEGNHYFTLTSWKLLGGLDFVGADPFAWETHFDRSGITLGFVLSDSFNHHLRSYFLSGEH